MKLSRPTPFVALWATCTVILLWALPVRATTPTSQLLLQQQRREVHATQLQRSSDLTSWMSFRSNRIQRSLRNARNVSKTSAITCLDTLLSQSHAVEQQADKIDEKIHRAALEGRGQTIGTHMSRMQVLLDRSLLLSAKARRCGQR